jgi:hypothetical protein
VGTAAARHLRFFIDATSSTFLSLFFLLCFLLGMLVFCFTPAVVACYIICLLYQYSVTKAYFEDRKLFRFIKCTDVSSEAPGLYRMGMSRSVHRSH